MYELKVNCNRKAQTSNDILRKEFNDVTRVDPSTSLISFKQCESAMFRSRRLPNIPATALEFYQLFPNATYASNVRVCVVLNEGIGIIFFSDKVYDLSQISMIFN